MFVYKKRNNMEEYNIKFRQPADTYYEFRTWLLEKVKGKTILEVLVETGLSESKSDGRRLIKAGAIKDIGYPIMGKNGYMVDWFPYISMCDVTDNEKMIIDDTWLIRKKRKTLIITTRKFNEKYIKIIEKK